MKERRKNKRVGISFPVECKVLPQRDYFTTVSRDLSSTGAQIISNEFIPKGNNLKVHINLIDEVIALKARVIWCNKERRIDRFSTGLEFVELSALRREVLAKFLANVYNS